MLIPITIAHSSSEPKLPPGLAKISHDEIVLIELQGTLEVESNHPKERNGKPVGTLKIDEITNKPTLLIGHHLLEGKIVSLPKPLAILHRSSVRSSVDVHSEDDVMDGVLDFEEKEEQRSPAWSVVGVVKKKIIFSKRPMPVSSVNSS